MSNQHFKGKYEVELKYRLESKNEFLKRLSDIPHQVMLENNTETDWYFDWPDNALAEANKSVCIRNMQPSGIKLWIVKGPEADKCVATNISDVDNAKNMLETMGYQVTLEAEKTRSIYFIDEFHITVDVLPGIGEFAEFAIMTDDETKLPDYKVDLEQLAGQFGLSQQHLQTKSYKQMYAEKGKLRRS